MKFLLLCRLQAVGKVGESGPVEGGVRGSSGLSDEGRTLIQGVRCFMGGEG